MGKVEKRLLIMGDWPLFVAQMFTIFDRLGAHLQKFKELQTQSLVFD